MKKRRWLYYTVIVGALPFIIRFLVFIFLSSRKWEFLFNAVDFVFLGLTLNLTNMNELNSLRLKMRRNPACEINDDNKETLVWWSTFFIILLSITLGLLYVSEQISYELLDKNVALYGSIGLCVVSLIFSNSVINKLDSIEHGNN
ncbi:hypothetical protein [Parabacteroides provencensis]|uniref:hypothetical protein n=1 Tax=Parabacteroides provencensis TaxID=1944636 RepID=UPI000C158507|nr:hypothetical protein [Parabacteroides provencensis]